MFIVSQRTASVRSADRILVLDDGKLVGFAAHDELLKECEVYREIYDSQFSEKKTASEEASTSERKNSSKEKMAPAEKTVPEKNIGEEVLV